MCVILWLVAMGAKSSSQMILDTAPHVVFHFGMTGTSQVRGKVEGPLAFLILRSLRAAICPDEVFDSCLLPWLVRLQA